MLHNEIQKIVLEKMLADLELPESAYERAVKRYEDLGAWLSREESTIQEYDPHVFAQGSFRLGTAIKPTTESDFYDLDLVCKLRAGISKDTHSQERLKNLIGVELASYREARQIETPLRSKNRCWRLEYKDQVSFHMDITPGIPEAEKIRKSIHEALLRNDSSEFIARTASETTIAITDVRSPFFRAINDAWNISNPEGYAAWFEERMLSGRVLNRLDEAQVDEIPIYRRKTSLQMSIQLLKRHRDLMFAEEPDVRPVSIIITTLAARAYSGEVDVAVALNNILSRMGGLVSSGRPRIPNPVDPGEDFADRWSMQACAHLKLEDNFRRWLTQAKSDFERIGSSHDAHLIAGQVNKKFGVILNESDLSKSLGAGAGVTAPRVPKIHVASETSGKPWRSES